MIYKKERVLLDEELGFLKSRTSVFEPSIIKWKKRIDFLGFDVDIEVSGTLGKLDSEQRRIVITALREKELLEKHVLATIAGLCTKYGVKSDAWRDYFRCSNIYIDNEELYISIGDKLNNLTYELELNGF